jgi:2-polyprenyl-3-methyl-5-hydroxy-6-metoxy-1,4-benzoquinol methylase
LERHPVYGAVARELGWVPAPRYALRRDRILKLIDRLPRVGTRRALEVGCGAGALLVDLAERGFACEALESSESAHAVATALTSHLRDVAVHRASAGHWRESFDLLLAFEVLEHIEDDRAALALWRGWIRPGGHLLLSVPARMSRWSPSDVWAGHFRRYERAGLLTLLAEAGFVIEHHECYGFPVSNLTEWVRAGVHGRDLRRTVGDGTADLAANTARSGTQRGVESRLYPLQATALGVLAFRLACGVQELFLQREMGTGYLVLARRADAAATP